MGLIVDENGHYRGWLASILCCCAALNEDEYPAERKKDKIQRERGTLYRELSKCPANIIQSPPKGHNINNSISLL
jgi:hypothetical protein